MNKTPAVRFIGFAEDWEQRKFGDIVQTRRGLTYKPTDIEESGIRVLRSSNIDEDTFVYGVDDVFVNPYAVNIEPVRKNDILITSANGSSRLVGKHALIKKISDGSAVHGGFMLLGRTKNYDFVNASMSSSWYTKFINVFAAGGNGAIGNLNKNDLDEQIILIPDDAEQIKIGEYFAALDNLITLHQRKYEKLKNIKKSMLYKMFPKNGSNVPEIRFKGFTDAWEQRKFGDIVQTRRGLTYKPTDIEESGIRVLRSSNIDEDTFVYGVDDVFVNPYAVNIEPVRKNDILITSANGSSRLVGKHALIKKISDGSAVHGGFMLLGRTKNYDFVNASMSSSWYTKFINVFAAGGNGAIGNLNKNDLDEQVILIPDDAEQIKIGEYFAALDNLITLHHRKLKKLEQIKQAMLHKMFV
ncbi:restriction endonuclease subunit S [Ruminococcus sp. FMB-CY1]|uniref:restriction endonuclease subunit S n=2 Tax=Ruminococcus TaxID=1263 RepID=UPI00208E4A0A|nr:MULTISPECIES: restriction endonuclease subunit S [unclassified Ruminococcus]USP70349.1 restriction endonuclease subunit S [Ruminococcus sp. FMBCY1]WBX58485.1 restriction endonuclease subunit S [Ruminococcus sp. FMB-CY1]